MGPLHAPPELDAPTVDAVRAELRKLSSDVDLRLSGRNRKFLAFVVNETLDGRADRIKAYTIAVDVFGRDESFDPASDPIVRIEATRIRTALAAYFDGPGAADAIHIRIPPGSYIPTFARREASAPPAMKLQTVERPMASGRAGPAFFVAHDSDRRDRCSTARAELLIAAIVRLMSEVGLDVFLAPPQRSAPEKHRRPLLDGMCPAYSIDIAVHTLVEAKRYDCRLTDMSDQRVIWSEAFDRPDDGKPSADTIDGLAKQIVGTILRIRAGGSQRLAASSTCGASARS